MAPNAKYCKLQDYESLESENEIIIPTVSRSPKKLLLLSVIALLVTSNILTWFLSDWRVRKQQTSILYPYTGLPRDHPVAFGTESLYTSENETLRNEIWEAINIDSAVIAVPDEFVAKTNLPPSQKFPWDDSKSIYLLNGFHALHCVKSVYVSLMEFWQDKPQTILWEHVIHCIDQLRQEVMCNADDTPRYSTADDEPVSGVGQIRMCRDWEKLEKWTEQYNACFRYINSDITAVPEVARYLFCPEGSPYSEAVEKARGHID